MGFPPVNVSCHNSPRKNNLIRSRHVNLIRITIEICPDGYLIPTILTSVPLIVISGRSGLEGNTGDMGFIVDLKSDCSLSLFRRSLSVLQAFAASSIEHNSDDGDCRQAVFEFQMDRLDSC